MSRRSRRLLSVLTAILLFFSNFSGLVVKAEENGDEIKDTTPPVLHSVSVDKQEVQFGDEVTVSLDITDDLSEITDVKVRLKNENYGEMEEVATYNPESKKFEVKLPITYTMETGKWNAYYVSVTDKLNNYNEYYEGGDLDFTSSEFTVLEGEGDTTPPVVKSVTVDKQEAKPGETVTVSIDANDDKSGIENVNVSYHGSNGGYLSNEAVLNDETKKYEVQFAIDETTKPGTWSISSIQVYDKAYNNLVLNNGEEADFSSGDFNVINENADITPPTIQGVTVDKKDAQPGDTVTVSIEASDDKSEINYLSVQYYGSKGGGLQEEAQYNPDTKKYEAKLTISEDTRPGTWKISYISIGDSANNNNWIDREEIPESSNGDFNVINDKVDTDGPKVNSVSVDRKEASPGDVVTLSIDASDEQSGVKNVAVSYQAGNKYLEEQQAVYNEQTKKYELKIPIDDSSRPGQWRIDFILAYDNERNWSQIYNEEIENEENSQDLSGGDFTVINENADITPPIIKGVTVDNKEAKPGDTVTVSVDAADDKSGINTISIQYRGSNRGYMQEDAVFNSETQQYEAKFLITNDTRPGTWSIDEIYVRDKADNTDSIYYEDVNFFTNGDFNVENDGIDITAPKVNGVSVDKTEATPGDKVTLSIDVTDAESDIEHVSVNYKVGNYYLEEQEAVYNSQTGKHEVTLPINDSSRPGTWNIAYIYTSDSQGNGKAISNGEDVDLSGGDFTVTNENADIIPPTIQSVEVDKKEAKPGDEVKVSIDATDDKSGIEQVYISVNGSKGGYLSKEAAFNDDTNKYEATFLINDTIKPGTWNVSYIHLIDHAGNEMYLDNDEDLDFSASEFVVINPNADITPPTVNRVTVDKTEAHPGDKVKVSLDVTDDKSSVESVSVEWEGSNGGYFWEEAILNPDTKKYEAILTIDEKTKPGTWSISSIYVRDMEENGKYYPNNKDTLDLSAADFTVINENIDMTPPTLKSVAVDKKEARPGEDVTVSIDATDDKSGIDYIYVKYRAGDRYLDEQAIYNSQTEKYELKLKINDSSRPGKWTINSIELSDKEGNNQTTYNEEDQDLSSGDFTVINENADITPPSLKGVAVDKKDTIVGDQVTVSIDVTDDKSGVEQVSVEYGNPNRQNMISEAIYNENSKKYEAKFSIKDTTKPGMWTLNEIHLSDKEGNNKDYYQDELNPEFSDASFTVINEKIDIAPPILKGVTINNKEAKPGDEVIVSIDAQDDKSGIQDISVDYKLPKKSRHSATAKFNSISGKYEAKIKISTFAQAGTWKIEGIELGDNEGNFDYIFNNKVYVYPGSQGMDLSNGNFVVKNEAEDITPPNIRSMKVNKDIFIPGETAVIEFDVNDSKSGVESVYVEFEGSNGGYSDTEAVYNETTQKYVATIPITQNTKSGTWSLDYISVRDNVGNYQSYHGDEYDFSGSNYKVINEESDITPPSVTKVSVDKTEGKPGDEITLSLEVTDDKSSIRNVSVDLINWNYKNVWGRPEMVWEDAIYNEQTHKYEVKIQIDNKMKPGTWAINSVSVSDNKSNWDDIFNGEDADFSNANFTIINDKADITAPEYHGMTVDKKVVNAGEEITFSVDTTDNQSGIDEVYVGFTNDMDDVYEGNYNPETKKYELKMKINKNSESGIWKVNYVAIKDNENNGLILKDKDTDFSSLDFEVINKEYDDYQDYLATYITDISIDKKVAKPDETVTLSLNFKDSTKIEEVSVRYAALDGRSFSRDAYFDEITGTYVVNIPINPLFKPGDWSLQDIYVLDKERDDYLSLSNKGKIDFSEGDFSVNNKALDTTAPDAPSVDEVTDQSQTVTGTTEAKATVVVKAGEKEINRSAADEDGHFSVTITAQKPNTNLTVNAVDSSENVSKGTTVKVKDITAPVKPVVNQVTDHSTAVTGKTEAGATVVVTIGTAKYTANKPADANGNYTVTIPQQKVNTKVSVTATDSAKLISPASVVTVVDKTAPAIKTVNTFSDKSKELTGTTEVGALVTVTIGTKKYAAAKPADAKGIFKVSIPLQKAGVKISVTAVDAAKNVGQAKVVTVLDKTAPGIPTVNNITDKSKEVSGKTEVGATATIAIGSKKYTSKPADAKGYYKVTIPGQKAGTKVYVTVKDKAGNVSVAKYTVVLDKTAPSAPTVKTKVKSTTKEVTGTAEAYAAITIKVGKNVIGTGTADKKGSYKVKIKAQKKKTVLSVTATDKAKNISSSTTVKVK